MTSRETWLKVSPWNSAEPAVPRCEILPAVYSFLRRRILLGFLLLFLIPCALVSQESPDLMVLLKGPYQDQGLPFLPRDISPHFRGEYLYRESRVSFFYLQRSLSDDLLWQDGGCVFEVGLLDSHRLGRVYYLPFRDGESIVVIVPEEADMDMCAVVSSFQRRFSYFLNTSRRWILPPFPGVVEISSSQGP